MSHDLAAEICKYLDSHMILHVLDFLKDRPTYTKESVLKAKLKVLEKTAFFDQIKQTYEELGEEVPQAVLDRQEATANANDAAQDDIETVVNFLSRDDVTEKLKDKRSKPQATLQALEPLGFEPSMLQTLRNGATSFYNEGGYEAACDFLYNFRAMTTDTKASIQALWGRLAANILLQQFDDARQDMALLTKFIEGTIRNELTPLEQLQQRAWYLHWSLFVYFFDDSDKTSDLIKLFLYDNSFANAVHTLCPHLIRYVVVVALSNHRTKLIDKRDPVRDVVRLIQRKTVTYTDPVIDFLISLYIDFDFDAAFLNLSRAAEVIEDDFFVNGMKTQFVDACQSRIFEMYCRVHSTLNISLVSKKLGVSEIDAEKWIVNLIRTTDIQASIVPDKGLVEITHQESSTYKQVLDKTRNLNFRTKVISDTLKSKVYKLKSQNQQSQSTFSRTE